ncbi:MAG: hypothetical protein EOP19_05940 [Hyphomicrobiales bacterium]|nr:MAG: hypothetical protein EOP19_05940 [Hyphomicrobiales bacterium]
MTILPAAAWHRPPVARPNAAPSVGAGGRLERTALAENIADPAETGYIVTVPARAAGLGRVRDILGERGALETPASVDKWRGVGASDRRTVPGGARQDRHSPGEGRVDRSALFVPAPSPGPSGIGRASLVADRAGRRRSRSASARPGSTSFDDFVAQDPVNREEEEALGYRTVEADAAALERHADPTEVEIDDERQAEMEPRRAGERES